MSEKLNCTNCCICDFKENLCDCDGDFCKEFKGIGRAEDFENAVMERIRPKGRWVKTGNKKEKEPRKIWWFECSECEFRLNSPTDRAVYNYCPHCGARMEVGE